MEAWVRGLRRLLAVALFVGSAVALGVLASSQDPPPPEVQLPGTQPSDGDFSAFTFMDTDICANSSCHLAPITMARDSMMAHASRDPLFWAALAIAEQDFLPNTDPASRGGAGHFCLRCHAGNGWIAGRANPTDGSQLESGHC